MNLLQQLFDKIDKLDERLDSVDKTLVKQEANLEEHMRRSYANEEMVKMLSEQIKPLNKHVVMVEGILKFVGVVSLVGGAALTVIELMGKL